MGHDEVWTSPDGLVWSRVPDDEAIFGGEGEQQMLSVAVGGPGLVAVGVDRTPDDGEADAAVWTSPDGFAWSRVSDDNANLGGEGDQRMLSVTAGGPGLVAVGLDGPVDGEEVDAAVWTSRDGLTWSRVPHDEEIFGGDGSQRMMSVATGGPGLIAVGSDGYLDDDYHGSADPFAADAAVWTSTDGLKWVRNPHDEGVFGGMGEQRMNGITAGGPGFVAVGMSRGTEPTEPPASHAAVWTSPDGISWIQTVMYPGIRQGSSTAYDRMYDVAVGEAGVVAVGREHGGDVFDAAIWVNR